MLLTVRHIDVKGAMSAEIMFNKEVITDSIIEDVKSFREKNSKRSCIAKLASLSYNSFYRIFNMFYISFYYYFMPLVTVFLVFRYGEYENSNATNDIDPGLATQIYQMFYNQTR